MKFKIALSAILVVLFWNYWTGYRSTDSVEQGMSVFFAVGLLFGSIPILWTIYKREKGEKDRKKRSGR